MQLAGKVCRNRLAALTSVAGRYVWACRSRRIVRLGNCSAMPPNGRKRSTPLVAARGKGISAAFINRHHTILPPNRVGGRVAPPALSQHRTCEVASGGFVIAAEAVPPPRSDALASGYLLRSLRPREDFHLQEVAPCVAHMERAPEPCGPGALCLRARGMIIRNAASCAR
jgi:hypothetical protein